jgi:hypothetical protein
MSASDADCLAKFGFHGLRTEIVLLTNVVIAETELGRERWGELSRLRDQGLLSTSEREYISSTVMGAPLSQDMSYDDYALAIACSEPRCLNLTPWLLHSTEEGRRHAIQRADYPPLPAPPPYIGSIPQAGYLERLYPILFNGRYPTVWATYCTPEVFDQLIIASSSPSQGIATPPTFHAVSIAILTSDRHPTYRSDFYRRAHSLLVTATPLLDVRNAVAAGKVLSLYIPHTPNHLVRFGAEAAVELHRRHPLSAEVIERLARLYIAVQENPLTDIRLLATIGLDLDKAIVAASIRGRVELVKWLWDQGSRPSERTVGEMIMIGGRAGDAEHLLGELDKLGLPIVVPLGPSTEVLDRRYLIEVTPDLRQRLIDMGQLRGEKSEEEILVKPAATRVADED